MYSGLDDGHVVRKRSGNLRDKLLAQGHCATARVSSAEQIWIAVPYQLIRISQAAEPCAIHPRSHEVGRGLDYGQRQSTFGSMQCAQVGQQFFVRSVEAVPLKHFLCFSKSCRIDDRLKRSRLQNPFRLRHIHNWGMEFL